VLFLSFCSSVSFLILQLFQLVFKRLEKDFESPRAPKMVSCVLALMWVSRRGFTETELVAILGVTYAAWSPFYLAMSEFIVSKYENDDGDAFFLSILSISYFDSPFSYSRAGLVI
jgi:hypothetical protein